MTQPASKPSNSASTPAAKLPRYTRDFKLAAVRMVVNEGHAPKSVARTLQVSYPSVKNWVQQFGGGLGTGDGTQPSANPNSSDTAAELQRLRSENRQLKEDLEFLKKATRFFARNSI